MRNAEDGWRPEDRAERKRQSKSKYTGPSYVKLVFPLLESHAWKALTHVERSMYVEFCHEFNGSNNGRISLSTRTLEKRLKVGQSTVVRGMAKLQEVGLLRNVKAAIYTKLELTRRAAEWRLTDWPCNVTGVGPTREWKRWKPENLNHQESNLNHQESRTHPPQEQTHTTQNGEPQQNGAFSEPRARASEPQEKRIYSCQVSTAKAAGRPPREVSGVDAKEKTIPRWMKARLAKIEREREKADQEFTSALAKGKIS